MGDLRSHWTEAGLEKGFVEPARARVASLNEIMDADRMMERHDSSERGWTPAPKGDGELRALMRVVEEDGARRRIAGLGPTVLRCAQDGDAVSLGIVEQGVNELALLVEQAVAGTLALESHAAGGSAANGSLPVAVVGGLVESGIWFPDLLWQAIGRRCAAAQRAEPKASPLEGAVLLARRQWLDSL